MFFGVGLLGYRMYADLDKHLSLLSFTLISAGLHSMCPCSPNMWCPILTQASAWTVVGCGPLLVLPFEHRGPCPSVAICDFSLLLESSWGRTLIALGSLASAGAFSWQALSECWINGHMTWDKQPILMPACGLFVSLFCKSCWSRKGPSGRSWVWKVRGWPKVTLL